jgi:hypothetical protein
MIFDTTTGPEVFMSPKDTPQGMDIAKSIGSFDLRPIKHLSISYIEWKEDCESSKSNRASKTGSIWVWTMTIFRKNKNLDSPIATFPIAIGLKTDNYDPVEEIVGHDIKDMMKSKLQAFIRSDNGIPEEITFSAAMFVSLGDQPKRRSGNKLMAGNSRAHTRWRKAVDHVKLCHVLPACKECMGAME